MVEPEPPQTSPPAQARRRRADTPSFAARRQMVIERNNLDIIGNRLDNHVTSCEGFRKVVLAAIGIVAGLIVAPIGYLYTNQNDLEKEIATIGARQQVVLSRLDGVDRSFQAIREEIGNRFAAVVAANSQRENTFNGRFEQHAKEMVDIRQSVSELQKDYYQHRLDEKGIEYAPQSSGPQRRR